VVNSELIGLQVEDRIHSCRDLAVWQNAMQLAEDCYKLTRLLPKEEMFGMSSQIRRSAASVAANIAEGHGREHTGSFVQFLRIAHGSLKELETHLLLASRVGLFLENLVAPVVSLCDVLGRMLRSLICSLQRRAAEA
jgi:four helix bundle protein